MPVAEIGKQFIIIVYIWGFSLHAELIFVLVRFIEYKIVLVD